MQVQQRTIQSGHVTELLQFNIPITINENIIANPFGRNGNGLFLTEEEYEIKQLNNRIKTLQRNTAHLWRLYNCNRTQYKEKDKFLTLTFRTLPDTIDQADYELKKFFQRVKYYVKQKIEYLGIRELQLKYERNGIHFHIILFNMPYVPHDKLLKLWCKNNPYMDYNNRSGVNIKAINEGYKEMSGYLTSYTLKQLIEYDFIKGHKTIIKSKGLIEPTKTNYEEIEFQPAIEDIKKGLSFLENKITYYRLKE